MELAKALDVRPGVTAIIGAGGKTTLLHALGAELARTARVLLCTTTHIRIPQQVRCLLSPTESELAAALEAEHCVCTGTPAENGKLTAPELPFSVLCRLADYVLVEADGAHERPIKAHADYEPVVPPEANQTILVLGLSGLGRPIAEAVHRPALFAAALGISESELVTPQLTAEFLDHEAPHTRVLLNQADTPECEALGRTLAALLHGPVCLGALQKGCIRCLS